MKGNVPSLLVYSTEIIEILDGHSVVDALAVLGTVITVVLSQLPMECHAEALEDFRTTTSQALQAIKRDTHA